MRNIFIIPFFFCLIIQAQKGVSFNQHKQFYLKGSSEIIGNNILSVHKSKPFNNNHEINDVLKLKYIDIDSSNITFSSSQANLTQQTTSKKIKYAGLYWSAVYKYEKGFKKIKNKRNIVYDGNNKRDSNVNDILLKTPNTNTYQTIKGEIIYDSFETEEYNNTKPYVCYADVTNLLRNKKAVNGPYTVGNIKATEGFIAGGCAGGWLLYVIYESEKETPKYFTTYNGFKTVDDEILDINFKDFKTTQTGQINTSLCLGTLEGDQKLKTDMCLIFNKKNKAFVPLSNKLRPSKNFFNGKITTYNSINIDRLPNSLNTLGFDVLKIKIPNTNNIIINNNQTEATIRLKTKADAFNLFFVAFETEINEQLIEVKANQDNSVIADTTKTNIENIKLKGDVLLNDTVKELINMKSISIPELEKGYYIITNVFSIKENANKWMSNIKNKGLNVNSYINPENGWTYIYLDYSKNPDLILEEKEKLAQKHSLKGLWIVKINY